MRVLLRAIRRESWTSAGLEYNQWISRALRAARSLHNAELEALGAGEALQCGGSSAARVALSACRAAWLAHRGGGVHGEVAVEGRKKKDARRRTLCLSESDKRGPCPAPPVAVRLTSVPRIFSQS